MTDEIKLRCGKCGYEGSNRRWPEIDPKDAVEIVSNSCPKCEGDNWDEECKYLDANGNETSMRKQNAH